MRPGSVCRALLISLFLLASTAQAEPLTLEQAITRADELSLDVQLQALSSEAAEAEWLSDPRAGAPSVRIGLRDLDVPTVLSPNPREPEIVTRVRVPLPRPWELTAAARQSRATAAEEDAELEGIRADVRLAVTLRFHALPLQRESVLVAQRLTDLRRQHLDLIASRRAEGLATALDWLQAEEARRDADEDRASLAANLAATEAELRLLLQWPVGEPLELVAIDQTPRVQGGVESLEALSEGLTERDPRVHEARAEIARAEARLHRLQLRSLPWLDWAQGGAIFKRNQPVSFEVGVAIDVPVTMWSAARTRAASQELARAKLRLADAKAVAEQQLASQVRDAVAAQERWIVENAHLASITEQATPMLALADPELALELSARLDRARLRVLSAFTKLVVELDKLDGEAHR